VVNPFPCASFFSPRNSPLRGAQCGEDYLAFVWLQIIARGDEQIAKGNVSSAAEAFAKVRRSGRKRLLNK
jgi:hypothetical protein